METIYQCATCKQPYPELGIPYKCPVCGGIYELYDIHGLEQTKNDQTLPGIWKYMSTFGLAKPSPVTYLGEGNTPLVKCQIYDHDVYYKLESLNPTGSYKDRGTAVLTSFLKSRGTTEAIEDSSGNAGASLAAYASAFNIKASIFIPDSASGPKRNQIETYGAKITPIEGPRINATQAALAAVEANKIPYASHAYMPFGLSGIATVAYEIVEQMHACPDNIIAPIGHGGLFLGMMLGFQALLDINKIQKMPRFIGIQPEAYAPLAARRNNKLFQESNAETLAEGTKIIQPVRGEAIFRLLKEQDQILAIREDELIAAYLKLSQMGFYVEPTSALVQAGLDRFYPEFKGSIVLILTGFGLKSDAIIRSTN